MMSNKTLGETEKKSTEKEVKELRNDERKPKKESQQRKGKLEEDNLSIHGEQEEVLHCF